MSEGQGGSDFTPPSDDPSDDDRQPAPELRAPELVDPGVAGAHRNGGGPDAAADHAAADEHAAEVDDDFDPEEFDPEKLGTAGTASAGPAPQVAPTGGLGPGEAAERFGHLVRHYRMGVSGAALALAWARQENAPDGATVVVEREVSPLGRLGRMWTTAPESTLSLAIVLRPPLKIEEAEATWLLAAVAAAEGAEAASGRTLATWWPDLVVDPETYDEIAALKVEIQLGPGKVKSAIATIRIDLDKLGLSPGGHDAVLEAVLAALDRHSEGLGEGSAGVAAAYDGRCAMLGRRVKLRLLPKGEARGIAKGVDRGARLELQSTTGMIQKVGIDTLRAIEAV